MSITFNTAEFSKEDFLFDSPQYKPTITPVHRYNTLSAEVIEEAEGNLKTIPLKRRVALLETSTDPKRSNYLIDNALRVQVPSDQFRNAMVSHWEARHSSSKRGAWLIGITSLICGVGSAVTSNRRADPIIVVAFAIGSIASLIFTTIAIHWTKQAAHQRDGWRVSPADTIAEERKTAFEKGFKYAYNKDLKRGDSSHHALLLPDEVRYLHDRYFDQFCRQLLSQNPVSDQQKKEWIDAFKSYNPISKSLLEYAYSGTIPLKFLQVSSDFESMATFLKKLQGEFDQLRGDRRRETNTIIEDINSEKALALAPFDLMLAHWTAEAKKKRDEKLAKLDDNDTNGRKQVEDDYQSEVRRYELYYRAAVTPVHAYFDNKVEEARKNLKKILEEIEKKEASTTAPHFNYAWGLLNHALSVKQNPLYDYRPQPFVPAQVFQIPVPSAPTMEPVDFMHLARQQRPQDTPSSDYSQFFNYTPPSAPKQ